MIGLINIWRLSLPFHVESSNSTLDKTGALVPIFHLLYRDTLNPGVLIDDFDQEDHRFFSSVLPSQPMVVVFVPGGNPDASYTRSSMHISPHPINDDPRLHALTPALGSPRYLKHSSLSTTQKRSRNHGDR